MAGAHAPVGSGVLLKEDGKDAENFIKDRTSQYPTNSYTVDVNTKDVSSFYNNLYDQGTPITDKSGLEHGRAIDTYVLVGPGGNNCTTLVCRAINAGGGNIGIFQSPSSLNLYFFNSNAIKQGYNPGLWGPKN